MLLGVIPHLAQRAIDQLLGERGQQSPGRREQTRNLGDRPQRIGSHERAVDQVDARYVGGAEFLSDGVESRLILSGG